MVTTPAVTGLLRLRAHVHRADGRRLETDLECGRVPLVGIGELKGEADEPTMLDGFELSCVPKDAGCADCRRAVNCVLGFPILGAGP